MTASYALMFGFGLLLLAAWAGWGAAVERAVLGRRVAGPALRAGWGLALTAVLGGALNLAGAIGPGTIGLLLGTGLALLAADGWRRRRRVRARWRRTRAWARRFPLRAAAVAVLGATALSAYAANVCSGRFNPHDDLQAYFVFPELTLDRTLRLVSAGSRAGDRGRSSSPWSRPGSAASSPRSSPPAPCSSRARTSPTGSLRDLPPPSRRPWPTRGSSRSGSSGLGCFSGEGSPGRAASPGRSSRRRSRPTSP